MKKMVIGTLVGGLILWFWQFLSWGLINIHGSQLQYTDQEQALLDCMAATNLPEGQYFIPNRPPGVDQKEYQEVWKEKHQGKPWARIQYMHKSENTNAMNMIRGIVIDLLAAFLFCYVLLGDPELTSGKVFSTALIIGVIAYLTIPYLNAIWFKSTSLPDLLDAIVPWALIGLVLGRILPKRNK